MRSKNKKLEPRGNLNILFLGVQFFPKYLKKTDKEEMKAKYLSMIEEIKQNSIVFDQNLGKKIFLI